MDDNLDLMVKWNSKEFDISYVRASDCVGALKELIFDVTGVRPERQKLLNLKFAGKDLKQQRFFLCSLGFATFYLLEILLQRMQRTLQ